MAAFTGFDGFVQAATGANVESIMMIKENRVAGAAAPAVPSARTISLWTYDGSPSGGAAPGGTAVIPDNTTAGATREADVRNG